MTNTIIKVNVERIEETIQMLREYVKDASIEPVLSVLEALKKEPENESLLVQLSETFGALGIIQGAVLTYAPYLVVLLSGGSFEDEDK